MLKKILLALVLVVIVFAVVVVMQPADFKVERSATIAAPAAVVFSQVNDLHKWEAWSPWAKLDPSAKATYAGPDSGKGAKHSWAGNGDVGEGTMTIVESRPNELVGIKLEFLKPFAATNDVAFTFKPDGDLTLVTWTMTGKNNFIAKAMHLFIDCDKMIGGFFDQGLNSMKTIAESQASK